MRRFFCSEIPESGDLLRLPVREEKHLFKTLRAKSGDCFEVLDGKGTVGLAELSSAGGLRIVSRESLPVPFRRIHLLLASPRAQIMDQLLRQCAELGVWRVQPVATEREVAKPARGKIPERWLLHLQEGCKQSGNPFLPEINCALPLAKALGHEYADGWYGAPDAEPGILSVSPVSDGDIAWLVGPEGGFTDTELQLIRAAGFGSLRLGPWIMRLETAAIVGAAMLISHPC